MSQTIKRVKINATCIFNGGKLCSAIVADANLGERNFVDHAWEGKVVGVGSTVAIADTGSSNPLSEEEWGGATKLLPAVVTSIGEYRMVVRDSKYESRMIYVYHAKPIERSKYVEMLGFKKGVKVVVVDGANVPKDCRVGSAMGLEWGDSKKLQLGQVKTIDYVCADGDIRFESTIGYYSCCYVRLATPEEVPFQRGDSVVCDVTSSSRAPFDWDASMDKLVGHVGSVLAKDGETATVQFQGVNFPPGLASKRTLKISCLRKPTPDEKEAFEKLHVALAFLGTTTSGIETVQKVLRNKRAREE